MKFIFRKYTKPVLTLVILLFVSYLSSLYFFRIDLSSDRRYSLSQHTIEALTVLDDKLEINVFLSGDIPLSYKRFEKRIREQLEEFSAYAPLISFNFIDPYEKYGAAKIGDLYHDLGKLGIVPENIKVDTDGGFIQKKLFPGATLKYKGKILGVNFLIRKNGYTDEQNLNASEAGLEYAFANGITQIAQTHYKKVAVLQGNGELDGYQSADLFNEIHKTYDVEYVAADSEDSLNDYDLLLVLGPKQDISFETQKALDAFVMAGKPSIWLVDGIDVDLQTLRSRPRDFGLATEKRIMGMLFNYGVRVNYDLLADRNCAQIPVNIASVGETPKYAPASWMFSPVLNPVASHPITKNLNFVQTEFISSLDTVNYSPKLKKTVLLTSSPFSKIVKPPVKIGLDWIDRKLPPEFFNSGAQMVSILMEGRFRSSVVSGFSGVQYSEPTKMIVLSDAAVARNEFKQVGERVQIQPLGEDRFMKQVFANKDFLLNCVHYCLSDNKIFQLKSRELKLRVLNAQKVEDTRSSVLVLNMVVPVLVVLLLGLALYLFRRKIYLK